MPSEVSIRQYHEGEYEATPTVYVYVKYDECLSDQIFGSCNSGFKSN